MKKVLFEGNVNVYLQGKGALFPFGKMQANLIKYYIGNISTRMVIKDFRQEPVNAVHEMMTGEKRIKFSKKFNQAANILIEKHSRGLTIEMRDAVKKREKSRAILWLGVIHDRKMPVHRITWHIFKPISQTSTAFAAIVED